MKCLFETMCKQTRPLFSTPHVVNLMLICALQFGLFSCGNGLILWMPDLFSQLYVDYALHPVDQRTICQVVEHGLIASNQTSDTGVNCTNTVDAGVYQNTLIIGGVGMMAYIINGYFIDTVGKRNILVINLVTSGTAGIGLYFARSAGQVLTLACVFLALSSTCISVVSTAAIELFPTHLRAMAMCISLMMGRLGTMVASLMVGLLLELNCASVFFTLAGIILFLGKSSGGFDLGSTDPAQGRIVMNGYGLTALQM
uniref:Major facilitator superfamily (MFS) profile domain-containing protein n=1 Tax=Timema genevievae TaxID=629358 RepID=A0A7R9K827_TIMGE|nr:unnamed protein product [Timema genevievae]